MGVRFATLALKELNMNNPRLSAGG